jgi:O-antigen/teichoic acid export membrane protein
MNKVNSKSQTFFGSAFYYTLGVILAQGTAFITLMLFNRLMLPDQYSLMTLYGVYFGIFGTIEGIQAYGSMNNARLDFGTEKLNAYTSATFGLGIVSLAALMVVFLLLQNVFTVALHFSFSVVLLCIVQGFFFFTVQHLAAKYQVQNRPGPFVFWTAAVAILRLAVSTALVLLMANNQYMGDVYGSSIAYGAVGIAAAIVIVSRGKTLFNAKWWKYCLKISMPLVFSALASTALLTLDRIMMDNLSTPTETGVYSFVYNIAIVTTAVWLAFNKPWVVWYFDKSHAGKKDEIIHLYKKYSLFVTLLSVAFTLVCPEFVRIIGAPEFQSGVFTIPLLAAGCYFIFLYSFPVNYESYKQKTVYIAVGTVAAAALNIGLNFYAIPHFGGAGAAAASLISFFMLFVFHYCISKYVIKGFQLNFIQLLIPALYIFAAMGATYLFMDMWPVRWIIGIAMLVLSFRTYRQSRHIMMT